MMMSAGVAGFGVANFLTLVLMPFPIDVARFLEYAPVNTPLRVASVPFETLRSRLAWQGLHEGDEIVCRHHVGGLTAVTTQRGEEIVLDRKCAIVIEVAPVSVRAGCQ